MQRSPTSLLVASELFRWRSRRTVYTDTQSCQTLLRVGFWRILNRHTPQLPVWTPLRAVCHCVSAANFEQEVLQSQQAICLVYHIENSNCRAYLEIAEKLVNELNDSTTLKLTDKSSSSSKHTWLKLCACNADENRNLASAFSVERAKLPITYFIMQGTIIDKVTGHVKDSRLQNILFKFLEHYQKEMNVDLLVARGDSANPLAAAASTNLRTGATTQHSLVSLTSSLTGGERIRLPEESEKLDGIRRTIQEAKRQAHSELLDLQREIGLDVRNLSPTEMHSLYHKSVQFSSMAAISALEALFLARCYASIGDIARKNVVWARKALQEDFEPAMSKANIRPLVALIDVNLVKGDARVGAQAAQRILDFSSSGSQCPSSFPWSADPENVEKVRVFFSRFLAHIRVLESGIDEFIDTRAPEVEFPSSFTENVFQLLKESKKMALGAGRTQPENQASHWSTSPDMAADDLIRCAAEDQFWQTKTVLTALFYLHPSEPKAHNARARLASILY